MKKVLLFVVSSVFILTAICQAETVDVTYDTYTVPDGGQKNGELAEFWAGKRPGCGHDENGMVYFDLSPYMGFTIESAVFNVNRFFGCASNVTNADIFAATESWDESYAGGHISHDNQVWANEIINNNGWWAIDIKDLVQAWLNGEMTNYGFVMECHTGSGTSKFHSKDASNTDVRPYLEIVVSSGTPPTVTPTAVPTGSHTATPTPTPGAATPSVTIEMPTDLFRPGNTCGCDVIVNNNDEDTMEDYPLCVLLMVYGNFYFAPGLTESFDWYDKSYPVGDTSIEILPEFNWPNGCGSADGIQWMAALLTPDMTDIVGDLATFTFGWSE